MIQGYSPDILRRNGKNRVVRIAEIQAGSIADELELEIGTRIVRINGQYVRDGIDLTFLLAESALELEAVSPSGEAFVYEIERDPAEPVGIVAAPDTIRECANECVFCFIDGNPPGVRDSLWLRDDDFRLSFTYGSYVTLTNLGPKGLQRLIDQRISPLYVSVHATEPDVRIRLLKNDRAGLIMEQLAVLLDHGLEVHTQIVLCPGWNDGPHLTRTIDDLWSLGEGVRSLSVVPVGLTRYNLNRPVRPLTPEEAQDAIATVERARNRSKRQRGRGWCYAADDMYLLAGQELPGPDYYDEWILLENGVGSVRRALMDFETGLAGVPRMEGCRIRIVTGGSMAPFFVERAGRLARATRAEVEIVHVKNRFFGETVTAAGLLAGADIRAALGEGRANDLILLPGEALNADRMFIDSLPLSALEETLAPARVAAGLEITATLRDL